MLQKVFVNKIFHIINKNELAQRNCMHAVVLMKFTKPKSKYFTYIHTISGIQCERKANLTIERINLYQKPAKLER